VITLERIVYQEKLVKIASPAPSGAVDEEKDRQLNERITELELQVNTYKDLL